MENEQPNTAEARGNERVRFRVRIDNKEVEIEGSQEYVEKREPAILELFSRLVSSTGQPNDKQLAVASEANGSTSHQDLNGNIAEEQTSDKVQVNAPDLITFFQSKSPQTQRDEVLVITYFYQQVLGRDSLILEDYAEAYNTLKKLAVEMPSNMKSSVRNVVDRTKFLYNPERGKYLLTLQGEQFVNSLGGSNG